MKVSESVSPKNIKLLSIVTKSNLDTRDVTPPVIFLAALITVLLGVMLADKKVTSEEKQRWQERINHFIPTEGNARQLAQLLSKGIREHKIYNNPNEILSLTESFSKSEKLLLIGFGYEMAFADSSIDESEKRYLRKIGQLFQLNADYLDFLELAFEKRPIQKMSILTEIKQLLDPARFHELDTIFVEAANSLLLKLDPVDEIASAGKAVSFGHLQEFQMSCKRLDLFCNQLYKIVCLCSERDFLPTKLVDDIANISRKLQSQRFRVAVVGEFSQGKSTLLNALLGEDIQPVKAIPCSGTITVLRYGSIKKAICYYKDGHSEEISVDQYKEKASIPKSSGSENRSDELANSEIEQITLEHPELELCKNGVEIVDSPGLNEHPDRTSITEKLIKETDAVLFLMHASRLLSEREKELIKDIRKQITNNQNNIPANNLFMLVNFIDLLDNEEDKADVEQRLEQFLRSESLIIKDKDRVHYISAKAVVKKQNEYLHSFDKFTQSLEHFLTFERGKNRLDEAKHDIQNLIRVVLSELQQAEKILDGDIKLSKNEVQNVLEKIGEASGREVKLKLLLDLILESVIEDANESWNEWVDGLGERLGGKAQQWSSTYSAIWSREQLIADYAKQFNDDLSEELNGWIDKCLKKEILIPAINYFDNEVEKELEEIQSGIESIKVLKDSQSSDWVFYKDRDSNFGDFGLVGNIGLTGLGLAVFVPAIILAGPILALVGGLVAGGLLGTGVGGVLGIDDAIKTKVFEEGCEQFVGSLNKTFEKIDEIIDTMFCTRFEQIDEVISRAISLYENLLEQQQKAYREGLEQCRQEKIWIAQQCFELEKLSQDVNAVNPNLTTT